MRVAAKHVIQSYSAQRNLGKSALSQEQEGRLKQHLEETRRILKSEESNLSFADILQNFLSTTRNGESH